MSVGLSVQNDVGGQALAAHSFWEGFVVGALIVDLVGEVEVRHTVLALLIWSVLILALLLHFYQKVLKRLMLGLLLILLIIWAIGASLI